MLSRLWLKLAAVMAAVALLVAVIQAWRADRRDRAQLAAELAATKQLLAGADARQHDRDAQLAQTLSALAAEKRNIVTPAQIIRELPNNIPLPAPITLQPPAASVGARYIVPSQPAISPSTSNAGQTPSHPSSTNASTPIQPNGVIPSADLKPLYDFTLDCKACQAKLSVAQNDLADERQKTAALTKERDDALRIAKGGGVWHRVGRAAKWFLIGAAAGAIISKAH